MVAAGLSFEEAFERAGSEGFVSVLRSFVPNATVDIPNLSFDPSYADQVPDMEILNSLAYQN
jgi:hypothetical protein